MKQWIAAAGFFLLACGGGDTADAEVPALGDAGTTDRTARDTGPAQDWRPSLTIVSSTPQVDWEGPVRAWNAAATGLMAVTRVPAVRELLGVDPASPLADKDCPAVSRGTPTVTLDFSAPGCSASGGAGGAAVTARATSQPLQFNDRFAIAGRRLTGDLLLMPGFNKTPWGVSTANGMENSASAVLTHQPADASKPAAAVQFKGQMEFKGTEIVLSGASKSGPWTITPDGAGMAMNGKQSCPCAGLGVLRLDARIGLTNRVDVHFPALAGVLEKDTTVTVLAPAGAPVSLVLAQEGEGCPAIKVQQSSVSGEIKIPRAELEKAMAAHDLDAKTSSALLGKLGGELILPPDDLNAALARTAGEKLAGVCTP
ncbi:MAG: hypothetical protein GMKNLPBB_02064 [Myxococcota bacterium]|nr:hypothetical protein [Myxococcota bacterium]